MTACTDDERREVARRLRELPGDSTYPDLIGVIADHDGWYPAADAADRLADLIEPGESGQNRDRNQDTVQIESPAVQKACECDREALLALADELDSSASMLLKQNDLDPNRKRSGMRRDHALSLMAASGCIRKALGVES